MTSDIAYQLGFVHGLRGTGIKRCIQWLTADYMRGYTKGIAMKHLHLQQEENYVKRSGHQGLRQTASDTAVFS